MRLNDRDELVWEFPWGEVTQSRPVAWQLVGGEPVSVSVGYRVDVAGRSYGFELGAYDARRSVWIDPIVQATYLGGFNPDHIRAVGVHPLTGEVYVAGYTQSTDFPQTSGGGQSVPGGGFYDAFIARFNHSLTSLLQSTYVGGLGHDLIHDLAFRPSTGEVWVVGGTDSWDLPGTSGGAQSNLGGSYDAFVMRLNAPLTSILQASYFGGSGYDYGYGLAVHPSTGDVYLSGWTTGDLPNTAGGAQATYGGGGYDVFVARLNASLTTNLQATYLGGSQSDYAYTVRILATTGEVYAAGGTDSPDLPGRAGGAQPGKSGSFDAFVARWNPALSSLSQSTYLGGSGYDDATNLAFSPDGQQVYIAGKTASNNLPNTSGSAQPTYGGGTNDGFVARLAASLLANPQTSYFGGTGLDEGFALVVHPSNGEVYLGGWTTSTQLPGTLGAFQESAAGAGYDAFLVRWNATLASLLQASYLGGTSSESAQALAFHAGTGELLVAGSTASPDFPATVGGAQASNKAGPYDGFLARITADLSGLLADSFETGDLSR